MRYFENSIFLILADTCNVLISYGKSRKHFYIVEFETTYEVELKRSFVEQQRSLRNRHSKRFREKKINEMKVSKRSAQENRKEIENVCNIRSC